jgi:hypothetical protein
MSRDKGNLQLASVAFEPKDKQNLAPFYLSRSDKSVTH